MRVHPVQPGEVLPEGGLDLGDHHLALALRLAAKGGPHEHGAEGEAHDASGVADAVPPLAGGPLAAHQHLAEGLRRLAKGLREVADQRLHHRPDDAVDEDAERKKGRKEKGKQKVNKAAYLEHARFVVVRPQVVGD